MKKLVLAAAGLTLMLAATPLAARPRQSEVCRIVHPAYYYQSLGRRSHLNHRRDHFLRFHARYNVQPRIYRQPYQDGRYRYDRYRDHRYQNYQYRDQRYVPRYRRHRLRRPRVGVYLEF